MIITWFVRSRIRNFKQISPIYYYLLQQAKFKKISGMYPSPTSKRGKYIVLLLALFHYFLPILNKRSKPQNFNKLLSTAQCLAYFFSCMVSWQQEEFKINYNPGKMGSTYIVFDLAWPPDLFLTKQYQRRSLLLRLFLWLVKILWSIIWICNKLPMKIELLQRYETKEYSKEKAGRGSKWLSETDLVKL